MFERVASYLQVVENARLLEHLALVNRSERRDLCSGFSCFSAFSTSDFVAADFFPISSKSSSKNPNTPTLAPPPPTTHLAPRAPATPLQAVAGKTYQRPRLFSTSRRHTFQSKPHRLYTEVLSCSRRWCAINVWTCIPSCPNSSF